MLTGTGGEICLTHAMKRVGEVHDFSPRPILRVLIALIARGWLWISVGLLAVSFYAFLTMLSWYPVSFVVPATSLAYVAGPFGAQILSARTPARLRVGRALWLFASAWRLRLTGAFGIATGVRIHVWRSVLRHVLRDAVFAAALVSLAFYLFGAWAAWRFFSDAAGRF